MDDQETSAAETEAQCEEHEVMSSEDLDSIRFPSYRTASKLRSLQRRSLLHHIDIWNMIEAFRENGLNEFVLSSSLGEVGLRSLLSSLYVNLGKRLPPGQTDVLRDEAMELLCEWLLRMSPKSKLRCVKTALAALAAGKLMDKLRYIFSQCADGNGHLIHKRFNQFLKDLLKLPQSLGEYEAYKYNSDAIFSSEARVNVNDFLETMMSDPGPACLSWLLVLHRIINAEGVHHPVTCGYCRSRGFNGLRYKSDRDNYHLCQNCFWRGHIGPEHKEDVFKEYNSFKSNSGRSSFKKSLQCIGNKSTGGPAEVLVHGEGGKMARSKSRGPPIPSFPEQETPIPLSNGGFLTPRPSSRISVRHPPHHPASYASLPRMDNRTAEDEHSLIAEYTTRLNDQESRSCLHSPRQLVQELEKKNQEIIRDITKLRQNNFSSASYPRGGGGGGGGGLAYPSSSSMTTHPLLITELHGLRTKKDDLDQRLSELQSTRRDLMTELEELMKLLKNQRMLPPGSGPGSQQSVSQLQQQQFLLQKQLSSQQQQQHQRHLHHQHQAQISSYLGEMMAGMSPDSYPPNPSSVASLSD